MTKTVQCPYQSKCCFFKHEDSANCKFGKHCERRMCFNKHCDFESSEVDSDEEEIDDYDESENEDEEQFDPNAHMIEFNKSFGINTAGETSANENRNHC